VKKAPLADPNMVSKYDSTFVISLEDSVVSDVDIVPEEDRFRVEDPNPFFDNYVISAGPQF
jgi:hypothetical protein